MLWIPNDRLLRLVSNLEGGRGGDIIALVEYKIRHFIQKPFIYLCFLSNRTVTVATKWAGQTTTLCPVATVSRVPETTSVQVGRALERHSHAFHAKSVTTTRAA